MRGSRGRRQPHARCRSRWSVQLEQRRPRWLHRRRRRSRLQTQRRRRFPNPAAPRALPSRWSTSSWFASGGGLQEAAAAHPALPPPAEPAGAPAPQQEGAGLRLVGGARAQSRFSGKTAIPIATTPALSSAGAAAAAAPPSAATQPAPPSSNGSSQRQLQAAAPPAPARHAAWASSAAGRTIDGSVPGPDSTACGEHVSRWVFDTATWQWRVRGGEPCALSGTPSDKHQLAARRWGDSRDSLGPAALQRQQAAAGGGGGHAAAPAGSAGGVPAKRPRLQVGAMTGDTSDGGWAAVGGLHKQKAVLMEAAAYPLAHPRLFARLGAGGARGVLLHGPPGGGRPCHRRADEEGRQRAACSLSSSSSSGP